MDVTNMDSAVPTNVALPLVFGDIKHSFQIDRKEAPQFKHQWDQFRISLANEGSTHPKSAADLGLQFLEFLHQNEVGTSTIASFLRSFGRGFLQHTEIHSLVSSIPGGADIRQSRLRSYYAAVCSNGTFLPRKSALLAAAERGRAQLFAIFGGQGPNNPKCTQDLANLYATYRPFLADLVDAVAPRLYELSCLPDVRDHCFQGRSLDLQAWLQDPSTIPNLPSYIASAPVSLPLIGILGLADFCIACKILGKTPGEFGSLLRGVTGHSHGIVVATAVAIADSWESFYKVARLVVDILFWTGVESYRNAPRGAIPTSTIHGSVEKGYGQPSPMLSVRGLNQGQIEALIEQFNGGCHSEEKLYLSLANARDNFVVAGPASALVHFNSFLEARKADDTDQARVPFSKRKPVIVHQFLPISAPFHTPYLREAAARVKEALSGLTITAESLRIPVYHSRTGQDLVDLTTSNLVEVLVDALMCDPCNWPAAITFSGASHIVAFGRGIGELVRQIKDGCGVRVILGSALESRHKDIGTRANLFSPRWLPASTCVDSWAKKFQPRLALSATGGLQLETRLTQLLGTPPVMVAGMIPTTAHWDFVSAVMNAGYHIELAGGGYHCAADMSTAINELVASVPAARGVTCNLIYANPQALAWQIALLRQLSQKGFPVDGLTIGAGVPAPEVVAEYISSLSLRHIGFRPGSVAAIQQVIKIAQLCPDFPIILQWTGGRAGGHHSLEDFHLSILKSYSAIRKCQNIILVAGSGFGGGDEYQYLSGSWSSALGYAPMPFDGILLGSRMMAVREAHTSPAVKKCIVAQYSHKEEESAKDVLDGISRALVERFQQEHDPSLSICSFDSGAMVPNSSSSSDGPHPLTVPTDPLMSSLRSAEEPPNWTSVFVNGAHTIQGRERRQNPFPRILQLRPGDSLTIDQENQTVVSTTKVESGTVVTAKMVCQNGVDISVELHQPSAFHQEPVILPLQYRFDPGNTSCRLSEAMEGRNDRIKSFYSQLWFGEDVNPDLNLQSVFRGPEMRLTSNLLHNLLSTVNQSYTTHENMFINSDEFPISAGIIIAREVLLKPLTLNDVDGDLLRLVHESYDFGYYNGANPLRVGDIVTSKSRVKALHIKDSGKQLVVEAIIERQGQPVMRVTSSFLFRGSFDDFGSTFQHKIEPDRILEVTSVQEEAILRARKWFVLKDTSFSLVGKTLLFKLETNLSWKNALEYQSLAVHGSVYAKQSNGELVKVGAIQLSCGECVGNPVVDFLERKGLLTTPESDPKSPGWSGASSLELQIPSSNERYARVSGDFNPIHVSNIFASWAGLPGTITHSMYTSAVSAGVLEHLAADGQFSRVRRWKASFTGMVLPSDTLSVKLQHTGMRDGRMVFRVSAKKHDTDKIVLDAEAELEQPQTAYIFTDQGSQVQGMGMGLYKSCPVAKAIWEKVDQQFKSPTSIIDIIKSNPKILTVHFRGERRRKMQDNYLALSVDDTIADGPVIKKPILRHFSREAQSHTFSKSGGSFSPRSLPN